MDNQKFVPISCCVYDTNMGAYLNQFNCQSFKFGPPRYMDPTAARNDALHYKVRPATQKGYMVIIKKKKKNVKKKKKGNKKKIGIKTLFGKLSPSTLHDTYKQTIFETIVSSPEHEVLMVSYCDQSMSFVRRQQFVLKANFS